MAMPDGYEQKFANFIRMCDESVKGDAVVVAHPWVLGDTDEEVIESLSRLADAQVALRIVSRAEEPTGE